LLLLFSLITENSALRIFSSDSASLSNWSIEFLIFISSCLPINVDIKLPFLSKRFTINKRYLDHYSLTKTIVNKLIFVIIKKVNFFTRLIKSINFLIWGDV